MCCPSVAVSVLVSAAVFHAPGVPKLWEHNFRDTGPRVAYTITTPASVVDEAIQMHGGIGISQDTPLAAMWSGQRTLRLADGPDAVHRMVVGRNELKKYIARADEPTGTFRDG